MGGETTIVLLLRVDVKGALDDEAQYFRVDGVLLEIIGAEADGAHGVGAVYVARHHDHLGAWRLLENLFQRREPLADANGVGRQTLILRDHRRLVTLEFRERGGAVARHHDIETLEAPAQLAL